MKKMRIMLPVAAFLMAVASVFASGFAPISDGYYHDGTCSQNRAPLNEAGCDVSSDPELQICTVTVSSTPFNAYNDPSCIDLLRKVDQ